MPPLDDEIRDFYRGPLAEFTPVRQAVLKRLLKSGDPRAVEVKALRKPTPSAWAVNQLFEREAEAMARFAALAGQALSRRAGPDGASAVREALASIRSETARLSALALGWLTAGEGTPGGPSSGVADRVRQNLEAIALDSIHAGTVERGWLDVDLPPPGFEGLAALQLAAEAGRGPGPRDLAAPENSPPTSAKQAERDKHRRIERAREELERAERQAADDRQAAGEATQAADRARFEAARVAKQADQARQAAIEAQRRADQATAEVEKARDTLRRVERE